VCTVLIYLNTMNHLNGNGNAGGTTLFPRAMGSESKRGKSQGVRVEPVQGRALLWWNVHPDGRPDQRSIHESQAVANSDNEVLFKSNSIEMIDEKEHGPLEKWALTKWIRAAPFEMDESMAATAGF
jgi:hypothetical protein